MNSPPSSQNWADKTIWTGDNLHVMRGMNSASVDLIYLDPPFNSKADYAAPIGSAAAGAAFKDTWTLSDIDIEWIDVVEDKHPALWRVLLAAMTPSDKSYLVYMAIRMLEMHRILKPTGSLYLHCDPTMSHYLKLLLDVIFGRGQFRNEMIWHYKNASRGKRQWAKSHDVVLWFSKGDIWTFNRDDVLDPFESGMTEWRYTRGGQSGKPAPKGKTPDDVITLSALNAMSKERTGYPTQKPLALLHKIIMASSNSGDVVFDPFCGCATTLVAAHDLTREWVGIDISPKAAELVVQRIRDRQGLFSGLIHRTDTPRRTDLGPLPAYNSAANRKNLYGEQGGDCAGCRTHFEMRHLEVDHIIAVAKGGSDHIDNLQLLCGNCNRIKGDRGMEYLRIKLQLAA